MSFAPLIAVGQLQVTVDKRSEEMKTVSCDKCLVTTPKEYLGQNRTVNKITPTCHGYIIIL